MSGNVCFDIFFIKSCKQNFSLWKWYWKYLSNFPHLKYWFCHTNSFWKSNFSRKISKVTMFYHETKTHVNNYNNFQQFLIPRFLVSFVWFLFCYFQVYNLSIWLDHMRCNIFVSREIERKNPNKLDLLLFMIVFLPTQLSCNIKCTFIIIPPNHNNNNNNGEKNWKKKCIK